MKLIRKQPARIMAGPTAIGLLAAMLAAGCHKAAPAQPMVGGLSTNSPSADFVPERAKPVAPTAQILQDPAVRQQLQQLNGWLNRFLATYHRVPVSFAELTAAAGGVPPVPPAGYRYVVRGPSVTLQATQ
jgi:hypothetical protein